MTRREAWPAAAPLLVCFVTACTAPPDEAAILRYGLTLAPSGIDPHVNASAELGIPLTSVYDTLVVRDSLTAGFGPGLASRWSVDPSGTTYTFHLRPGVRFHDGTVLNADAVRTSLERALDPGTRSQKAGFMLGPLQEIEVVNDRTVVLHLREPFAPLLDSLSQVYLGIASPAALAEWPAPEYQFHQAGSGPYRFLEYIPSDHLSLERFADYAWASDVVRQSEPAVPAIEFRFYEDIATRALALERGDVQVIGEVPPHDALRLTESGRFLLTPTAIPGLPMQFFFNTHRAPVSDPTVRTALLSAVDRPAVVETVFGGFSPVAIGPLTADLLADDPGGLPAFDPQAAADLLEQAGWHVERGRRTKAGADLGLRIVVPDWGSHPEVAQLLALAWEELGVTVEVTVAAGFGPLQEAAAAGEYDLIAFNSFGSDPDVLTSFYISAGLFNWSGVEDEALDRLLERGRTSLDDQTRQQVYLEFARRINESALVLPIRDYVSLVVSDRRVRGLHFSPQGWFPYLIDLSLAP